LKHLAILAIMLTQFCSSSTLAENLSASGSGRPVVIAATSMIADMLEALAGDEVQIQVLIPPGRCPGHFDLKPSDAVRLSRASLVIRHDFQSYLDRRLTSQNPEMLLVAIETPGQPTVPDNYLVALEEVKKYLVQAYPDLAPRLEGKARRVRRQIEQVVRDARDLINRSELKGIKVLASQRQADLARWSGLEVVDEFTNSADALSASRLKELMAVSSLGDIGFVVGNLQGGGQQIAELISTSTGLPSCILSNFPGTNRHNRTYPGLLIDNLNLLAETARRTRAHASDN